jgi:hypothetical protein
MQEAYKPSAAALAKASAAREKMSMAAQKRLAARSGEKMALSVKQATKSNVDRLKQKAREKMSLKAYGATTGTKVGREGGEEIRDTIAPLSPEQHSKVQTAKREATPAKEPKIKKIKQQPAVKKPESRFDMIKRIAAKRKMNNPPVSAKQLRTIAAVGGQEHDHGGFDDLSGTGYEHLGGRHSMDEVAKWRENPATHDYDTDGTKLPKTHGQHDQLQARSKYLSGAKAYIKNNIKNPKNARKKLQAYAKSAIKMYKEEVDKGEYDYEGDMAMSQLKSIITNAKAIHDMLEPDTNLPEWVQSKITLAEDYIVTAANYLKAEKE